MIPSYTLYRRYHIWMSMMKGQLMSSKLVSCFPVSWLSHHQVAMPNTSMKKWKPTSQDINPSLLSWLCIFAWGARPYVGLSLAELASVILVHTWRIRYGVSRLADAHDFVEISQLWWKVFSSSEVSTYGVLSLWLLDNFWEVRYFGFLSSYAGDVLEQVWVPFAHKTYPRQFPN